MPKKGKVQTRRYYIYAPPRIYCYRSEAVCIHFRIFFFVSISSPSLPIESRSNLTKDDTPMGVISVELFIIRFRSDHLGPRLIFQRYFEFAIFFPSSSSSSFIRVNKLETKEKKQHKMGSALLSMTTPKSEKNMYIFFGEEEVRADSAATLSHSAEYRI